MHVNIFGLKISVENKKDPETKLAGYYDPTKQLIWVNPEQSKQESVHTLLHEMVHAAIIRLGWRQWLSHQMEETICECISTVMVENFSIKLKQDKK